MKVNFDLLCRLLAGWACIGVSVFASQQTVLNPWLYAGGLIGALFFAFSLAYKAQKSETHE